MPPKRLSRVCRLSDVLMYLIQTRGVVESRHAFVDEIALAPGQRGHELVRNRVGGAGGNGSQDEKLRVDLGSHVRAEQVGGHRAHA